jgi:hypothetical protein
VAKIFHKGSVEVADLLAEIRRLIEASPDS